MSELYRVVCGLSAKNKQVYTAIMKAERGLHNNMFSQLQLENPEAGDLTRIGGSMYIYDTDAGPKITIDLGIIREAKKEGLDLHALLDPSILATFQEMKEAGKEFSLREMPKNEDFYAKIEPVSAIADKVSREAQAEIERKRRREERMAYEAQNPSAPAWYRFQSRYSGD